jgi:hypothetical protein
MAFSVRWSLPISSGTAQVPDDKSAVALAVWAAFSGAYDTVVIGARTKSAATEVLERVRYELELNDLLNQDFPEFTHPIRCLQGIYQRRLVCQGRPVFMSIRPNQIVLPNTASGAAGPRVLAMKRKQATIVTASQSNALLIALMGR